MSYSRVVGVEDEIMERQLISKWMKDNDVDQPGLAARTGIKQSHISEFLAGKKNLGWDNIVTICRVTGIDLNKLAGLKVETNVIHLPNLTTGERGKVKLRITGYVDAEIVTNEGE